jgi:membrane protein
VLRHLEQTLNFIWGVRRERSWMRRFADYLAVLIVAPLFLGAALSMGASFRAGPVLSWLLEFPTFALLYKLGLGQIPHLLLLLGFSFVYWFFPDTRVKITSALLGGFVAALLFTGAQNYYVGLSIGVARYNAFFGGFAAIPLLLVWLYFCWAIVLLGAEVSFAFQNLAHYRLEAAQEGATGAAERELLATRIAVEVGRGFRDRAPALGADELGDVLGAPIRAVRELLALLDNAGIVSVRSGEERSESYQLGRPAETITVTQILVAVRGERTLEASAQESSAQEASAHRAVNALFENLDGTLYGLTDARTLADLLVEVDQVRAEGSAPPVPAAS